MAAPIRITRDDLDAAELRRAARRASSVAAPRRTLVLALVLESTSCTEAAQAGSTSEFRVLPHFACCSR